MGWNEWPLMIFTVLAQSAIGAFGICAFTVMINAAGNEKNTLKLERGMILISVLVGVGFLFSALHLGSPFKATNAFSRIGSSALSNEGFFGVLFIICSGLAWLLAMMSKSAGLRKVLLLAGLIMGALVIWSMGVLYRMPTVPTWNYWTTPASFIVTVIVGGVALASLIFKITGVNISTPGWSCMMGLLIFFGIIAAAVIAVSYMSYLSGVHTSAQSALQLIPNIEALQLWRFILLGVGGAIVLYQVIRKNTSAGMAFLGLSAIMVAEFVGRDIFYGLHMTVGMV